MGKLFSGDSGQHTNFCAITTKENLSLMNKNKVNFILTRQLEQPEFQKYLSKSKKPWILDCDAFELLHEKGEYKPDDFDKTLRLASIYKPTYIILPDYMCDMINTLRAAKLYKEKVEALGIHPLGVIQAKTIEEIKALTREFWNLGIRYFAIPFNAPKFINSDMRWTRIKRYEAFKSEINKLETESDKVKYIHFLGMVQKIDELYLTPFEVNSLDSGKPTQLGRELLLMENMEEISNDIHYHGELDLRFNRKQLKCIKKNIKFVRDILES